MRGVPQEVLEQSGGPPQVRTQPHITDESVQNILKEVIEQTNAGSDCEDEDDEELLDKDNCKLYDADFPSDELGCQRAIE